MTNSYQILIVDDDQGWLKRFNRYLTLEGQFAISMATSYQEALDLLVAREFNFDLVILDINLTDVAGNVDGLRVGNEIWKHKKGIKVIIISGSENAGQRRTFMNFVPNYIIQKQAFDKNSFLEKVYAALLQKSPWEI